MTHEAEKRAEPLARLVEAAYREGFADAELTSQSRCPLEADEGWALSEAREALSPKVSEQIAGCDHIGAAGIELFEGQVAGEDGLLRELHEAMADVMTLRRQSNHPWEREKAEAAIAVWRRVQAYLGRSSSVLNRMVAIDEEIEAANPGWMTGTTAEAALSSPPTLDRERVAAVANGLIAAKRAEPCSFGGQREAEAVAMEACRDEIISLLPGEKGRIQDHAPPATPADGAQ